MRPTLDLTLLEGRFAYCRLAPGEPLPSWGLAGPLSCVTRSREELSIVCPESGVPAHVQQEGGWRAFRVAGPLDFALVGVMAALAEPLARAGVSLNAVSTFDTDYLFVKQADLAAAQEALRGAGHRLRDE